MTNIVASIVVSILTNVTASSDEVIGKAEEWYATYPPQHQAFAAPRPPTWSNEVTEVIEVSRLLFVWNGESYAEEQRRVVSRKERNWRRTGLWAEQTSTNLSPVRALTNALPWSIYFGTHTNEPNPKGGK